MQAIYGDRLTDLDPLAFSLRFVICTQGLGLVHITPFKWVVFQENCLVLKAYLRLVTCDYKARANWRAIDGIYDLVSSSKDTVLFSSRAFLGLFSHDLISFKDWWCASLLYPQCSCASLCSTGLASHPVS